MYKQVDLNSRKITNFTSRQRFFFVFKIVQLCDLPNTAGMKATQLVIIAPLTTSNSGNTMKTKRANPMVCIDSKIQMTTKSEKEDLRADLKMQIRAARKRLPSSGTQNAKQMHQIHATCKSEKSKYMKFSYP